MASRDREAMEKLGKENAELRKELRRQWEYNHSERCDRVWPHMAGEECRWPLPPLLKGKRS
jgi:hypothetical protein